MIDDNRSKKFVLIPFCLICQAFQAQGIVKYDWSNAITPIVDELLKNNINLIQMPCVESLFGGCETGLKRKPKGIAHYDNSKFRKHCKVLALQTADMVKAILSNGYQIIVILGIEISPSCSVKHQYTNKGMVRRPGIFIEELKKELEINKINIPFLGINRRGIKNSLNKLKEILKTEE